MPDDKIDRELRTFNRLIAESLAIEAEAAKDAGQLGFVARAMVQATMPHRKVEGSVFERTNGHFSLAMLAHPKTGLPYGSVPRLLLAWLTTEAVRTGERELILGDSLSGFMGELGMVPTGGRWGSITRLKDQSRRLFSCAITAVYEDGERTAILNQSIADQATLWWDPKTPDQAALWKSSVTLSTPFFREVTERPVPIDLRALKALKKSPLSLDIYCFLTYRASYMRSASVVPWEALAAQFGSSYAEVRFFKRAFIAELRKVATVYSDAKFDTTEAGLVVKPTKPHVPKLKR